MKRIEGSLAMAAMAATFTLSATVPAEATESGFAGAVFVMTNNADANEVISFSRTREGTLQNPQHFDTGGRGSGGTVDPLSSQGSLTLSQDHSLLFAVNAGSSNISVFRVFGDELVLVDKIPTEGSEPVAVAQRGSLVYVANAAASNSVVGYTLRGDKLTRIPNSLRFLSGNGVGAGSIAFSPDGQHLLVTERVTNLIDVFSIFPDGTLSPITENPSAGPGAFSVTFAPNGTALVSETGSSTPNSSAISSYSVQPNGTLKTINASVPTLGGANCWNAVTPNGRFVYVANSASSSIAGFAIGANGALTPIPGTVVGLNPPGSTNLDVAVSADGQFLFTLNARTGTIGGFAINPTSGVLTNLGTFGSLPAAAGLNGIAAD